jgi:hypothetical protein
MLKNQESNRALFHHEIVHAVSALAVKTFVADRVTSLWCLVSAVRLKGSIPLFSQSAG